MGNLILSTIVLSMTTSQIVAIAAQTPEGTLQRRTMFGVQLAAVTDEVRHQQKLDGNAGVVVEKIFPGTLAAGG